MRCVRNAVGVVVAALLCCSFAAAAPATRPATRPAAARAASGPRIIRLGILSNRGQAEALLKWQATADYLTAALSPEFPGCSVVVVALHNNEVDSAVARRQVDFIFTNGAQYVQLEHDYGCERLATFKNFRLRDKATKRDLVSAQFGSIIFARADRADINQLSDLPGKTFSAAEKNLFGGWWMAEREMKQHGIDTDSLKMEWTEGTPEMVVWAVQLGNADAGTVRTDLLERMASDGSISLSTFKVLNARPPDDEFPFLCSTPLYPEWPIAVLKPLTPEDERIARSVTAALLMMDPKSDAAKKSRGAGWAIPLNYMPIHDLLRDLHIRPYENGPKITLAQATSQYRYAVIGVSVFLVGSLVTSAYVLRLNRRHKKLSRRLAAQLIEQTKAEKALQESEVFYHSLVQNLPQSIIRKDLEGRFTFGNENFCAEFDIDCEAIKGKTDFDLFPKPLAEKYRADDQAVIATGKMFEAVEEHVDGNGVKLYVQVIKTPLRDGGGKVIGTQGIFWDVSDRKRAELQLEEQNRLLEQTAKSEREAHHKLQQAQGTLIQTEKLAALGQMVAGVAHEINNPLSFVSNNVAVLQRDVTSLHRLMTLYQQADALLQQSQPELANEIRELAERIDLPYTMENLKELTLRSREGLKRIQQIVKDLRDFARLDSNDIHEADLNDGIESTVNIIRGRAKRKQVSLDMKLSPLPVVHCFPAKINQVILNLIANAIDACNDNGAVIVSTRPVLEAEEVKGVEIQVTDNGSGIDPEIRDRIFDPFFTTKPPGEGTGLGLAISYGIIQDHGGTIRVESEKGKGTSFVIYLPKAAVPTSAAAPVL